MKGRSGVRNQNIPEEQDQRKPLGRHREQESRWKSQGVIVTRLVAVER